MAPEKEHRPLVHDRHVFSASLEAHTLFRKRKYREGLRALLRGYKEKFMSYVRGDRSI